MGGRRLPLTRTGSWFKPELLKKDYGSHGDAYDDSKYEELAKEWNLDTAQKSDRYLTFVKQASKNKWIHLRLLADFMQIGRIPRDWGQPLVSNKLEQQERWSRASISALEYSQGGVKMIPIASRKSKGLDIGTLRTKLNSGYSPDASFRLYVVEDLSRNVIEALGTEFNIDPDFFRAHIVDYAWYNVRDRWREAQPLELARGRRNWFQLRYVTTRYFENKDEFKRAGDEAKTFNILRRPDDDHSKGWWDSEEAVVALTRCRATFWLKPKGPQNSTAIGVLLLDPTVPQGLPLWRGHRNFHPVPSFEDPQNEWPAWETLSPNSSENNAQSCFYEDFVYWAQHPEVFEHQSDVPKEHVPLQALLHLVGSEWLTMCDYVKTRLNQIDLETVDPEHFAVTHHVDVALGKLHMWRRLIPLYREMVAETLQHVFHFPCHAQAGMPRKESTDGSADEGVLMTTTPEAKDCPGRATSPPSSVRAYEEDFKLVLAYLEEYQSRIDRLTSVVTAVLAVEDARTANTDARNIGRLTWLATFFIPFGVVSGIFSMQSVSDMSLDTIRLYFAVTLPVAVVTVAAAWALHSPVVRRRLDAPAESLRARLMPRSYNKTDREI